MQESNPPQKNEPQTPKEPERKRPEPANPNGPMRSVMAWFAILAMVLLMVHLGLKRQDTVEEISYNPDFVQLVQQGRILRCEIVRDVSGVEYIRGELRPAAGPAVAAAKPRKFKVYITAADEELKKFLVNNDVEFRVPPQNPLVWQIVSSVLPVLLIFGLIYFLFMRQIRAAGYPQGHVQECRGH